MREFEAEEEEPGTREVRRRYSLNFDISQSMADTWNHIVNAEREYFLAALAILGIDEETITEMKRQRREPAPSRRHRAERIEVREVAVD